MERRNLTSTPTSHYYGAPRLGAQYSPIQDAESSAGSSCPASIHFQERSSSDSSSFGPQSINWSMYPAVGDKRSGLWFAPGTKQAQSSTPSPIISYPPSTVRSPGPARLPGSARTPGPARTPGSSRSPGFGGSPDRACPGITPGGGVPTPHGYPEIHATPMAPRRNEPVRRFSCKRQLRFGESFDMEGSGGLPDDQDLPEGVCEVLKLLPEQDYGPSPTPGDVDIVEGPRAAHRYIPTWVKFARNNNIEVFSWALSYYFTHMRWPDVHECGDSDFIDVMEADGIDFDDYEETNGFAPVWMFVLYTLTNAGKVDTPFLFDCIDTFFDFGRFPQLSGLPRELQWACRKLDVDDNDYYDY